MYHIIGQPVVVGVSAPVIVGLSPVDAMSPLEPYTRHGSDVLPVLAFGLLPGKPVIEAPVNQYTFADDAELE